MVFINSIGMKKLNLLIALLLCLCGGDMYAQILISPAEPGAISFNDKFIKPADLIIEGTVVKMTFFQSKTKYLVVKPFLRSYGDSNGTWYIKYDIRVHKLFKGNCDSLVTLIDINNYPDFEADGKKYSYNYMRNLNGMPYGSNKYVGYTNTFFLKKKYHNIIANVPKDAYYLVKYDECEGNTLSYDRISPTQVGIVDKGVYEFEKLEDFYKYLEKETGNKRKNKSNIQYLLFNGYKEGDDINKYMDTYFSDSMNIEAFYNRINKGKITQSNKDLFICNSKRKLNKNKPTINKEK